MIMERRIDREGAKPRNRENSNVVWGEENASFFRTMIYETTMEVLCCLIVGM
jgi:hypothetical protein